MHLDEFYIIVIIHTYYIIGSNKTIVTRKPINAF